MEEKLHIKAPMSRAEKPILTLWVGHIPFTTQKGARGKIGTQPIHLGVGTMKGEKAVERKYMSLEVSNVNNPIGSAGKNLSNPKKTGYGYLSFEF